MEKLNIAIFTDTFIPQIDGVVTATISLAKGLADRGHKVYLIAPEYRKKFVEFSYKDIVVRRAASVPAFFYEGYRFTSLWSPSLAKYLRRRRIDVVHFQTPVSLGVQAVLISKFLKVPLVGTFHTFFTDPQYARHVGLNNRFVHKISWLYAKMYYNRCGLVTCPSESAKRELVGQGFKVDIKVISNGIDFSQFDNRDWKAAKARFNPGGDMLLFVGRIAYEKNLDYLLDCFKMVLEIKPKTKLLIVGGGPQMGELKAAVKRKGLADSVVITGRIARDELVKSGIFKASKLFVTASTTETQGISTLEAQANGLVCVGADARGTKDLIRDNYNGCLVKYGDKHEFADRVISLLNDSKAYGRMNMNTLKEVKKHDIRSIIKVWESEYLRLIRKCGPKRPRMRS